MANSFRNSQFIFATNHAKASAVGDSFASILNSRITEIPIDSDSLGTFSGEVERPGSMLDALRSKVKLAIEKCSERFILVSEGSFGPASGIGLLAEDLEILLVHDTVKNVEITESCSSFNTNFASQPISNFSQLEAFLEKIKFGSHGLILFPDDTPKTQTVYKGITRLDEAKTTFDLCLSSSKTGLVTALSDMRANFNPTRLECIKQCAIKLANRLNTICPSCNSGGFGMIEGLAGLPCKVCQLPTRLLHKEKHECPYCLNILLVPRSDGITSADPSTCEWCNP